MEEIQKTRDELLNKLCEFLIKEMASITHEYMWKGYTEALKLYLDATEEAW